MENDLKLNSWHYVLIFLAAFFFGMFITSCGPAPDHTNQFIIEMPDVSGTSSASSPVSSVYVGCYSDQSTRALPNWLINSGATVETCLAAAQAAGYLFAGVQYGGQCFAGNTVGYTLLPASNCNMPCSSNSSETCGGTWANSVYLTGI